MFDKFREDFEDIEELMEAARNAPELLEDVDRKMNRVEQLEEKVLDMIGDVETIINDKMEDLTVKLLVLELKAYGAVFFVLLAGGFFLNDIGHGTWGMLSHGLAVLVLLSTIVTLYRYLGNDFVVDIVKLVNPFFENPELKKNYQVGDADTLSFQTRKKLKRRAKEAGFNSTNEYVEYILEN